MNETPILQGIHLVKHFDGGLVKALDDVSLDVRQGEFLALMGASGSGKSTLLHLLGTLDAPDSGELRFEGRPLGELGRLDRFRATTLGFVFQMHFLLPHLDLLDNVSVPLMALPGVSRGERRERAREALERVGLGHRVSHAPNYVSGGERQRAAIARAIVNRPRLILADEPTGNVDSATERRLLELFQELRDELGATFVVVTHDSEVAEAADRVVTVRDGRLVDPEAASSDPGPPPEAGAPEGAAPETTPETTREAVREA